MTTKIFYRRHYKLALCNARNKSRLFLRHKHLNVIPLLCSTTRKGKVQNSFEFILNRRRFASLIRGRGIVPIVANRFSLLGTSLPATQIIFGLRSFLKK